MVQAWSSNRSNQPVDIMWSCWILEYLLVWMQIRICRGFVSILVPGGSQQNHWDGW
jgi:hypothetical protein